MTVVRVFNNNVLLVRNNGNEQVVVGRGIGFSRHEGDQITIDSVTHSYMEVNEERRKFLEAIQEVNSSLLETISVAVDFASDLLGELHPSVYLLLADHLVFAVERAGQGETFRGTLTEEISALFPKEYDAAQLVLHFINARIEIQLPQSEAGFIALHLKAARSGAAVKQPLEQANELDRVMEEISVMLREYGINNQIDNRLIAHIAWLTKQLRHGNLRHHALQRTVSKELGKLCSLSRAIIACILRTSPRQLPVAVDGEIAFLALFLHGWQQTVSQPENSQ